MASRYSALFKVGKDGRLINEEAPTVPVSDDGPSLDELADVLSATVEYIRALLDREKRGHL
jgi:hypothetical protein